MLGFWARTQWHKITIGLKIPSGYVNIRCKDETTTWIYANKTSLGGMPCMFTFPIHHTISTLELKSMPHNTWNVSGHVFSLIFVLDLTCSNDMCQKSLHTIKTAINCCGMGLLRVWTPSSQFRKKKKKKRQPQSCEENRHKTQRSQTFKELIFFSLLVYANHVCLILCRQISEHLWGTMRGTSTV